MQEKAECTAAIGVTLKVLTLNGTNGTVAFGQCNMEGAIKIVTNLMDLGHCACFGWNTLIDSIGLEHKSGKRALYISFDCESG